jgi:tetratricopeptide (TPR) repeat protein
VVDPTGRQAGQYELLREAAGCAAPGSDGWYAAKDFLGYTAGESGDLAAALGHFTELRDTAAAQEPCPAMVDGLAGRAGALFQIGQHTEAVEVARQALAMAREIAYPLGEVSALGNLAVFALYVGDPDRAARLARQAWQITAGIPGLIAQWCSYLLAGALFEAGDLAAAETVCAAARQALGPSRTRAADDRGAAMSLDTAAEYALMLTDPSPPQPAAGRDRLSARERELITWSPRAAPTPRSPPSCTSASALSGPTWTGSGTRPAAAAAPT